MNGNATDVLNSRLSTLGIVGLATAFAVTALVTMPAEYALVTALFVAGTIAVYRLPVIGLSALVVAGVGPTLFLMTGRLSEAGFQLLGKVSLAEAIMSAMLFAVIVKGLATAFARPNVRLHGLIALLAACFCTLLAWVAFSTARNLEAYGIHTLGQVRYSYLILAVPAFAAIFLRSGAERRRFLVLLIVFSVGVTLAVVPIIGSLKGWGIGPTSRYFPSNVALGLLYGWVALLLAAERRVLSVPRWLGRVLSLPVVVVLLVDSHRSVWLTGLVLLGYFLVIGRISAAVLAKIAFFATAVVVPVLTISTFLGFDALAFISSRGSAIVNPSADITSSWRLDLWASNLQRWGQHPWVGEGFGGYYAGNAARGVVLTTGPHSLQVQTLVAMGAVGLALVIAAVVVAGAILWKALRLHRSAHEEDSLDALLAELGLGILISAQVYWAVYSFDYYSCVWVGVALAAALRARRASLMRHGARRINSTSTS